jgi:hypothetical protein
MADTVEDIVARTTAKFRARGCNIQMGDVREVIEDVVKHFDARLKVLEKDHPRLRKLASEHTMFGKQ